MSGGFFRGTSADQDTRFSNKQAKLLKSQKFPPELDNLIDTTKVKMDVIHPWIAKRATEVLGFEDEVLINFVYGLLEGKQVDGKKIQIQLTGFMEKNTGKFMKELWGLLLSAQKNASGVPQQFLDAKEEEIKKNKLETDRITQEIQKRREGGGWEPEQDRAKKMDSVAESLKIVNADVDANLKRSSIRSASPDPRNDVEVGRRHISQRNRRSIQSPVRSNSKSISKSRSHSEEWHGSRSPSVSPRRRRYSRERLYRSPTKRSFSPQRIPRYSSRRRSPYFNRSSRAHPRFRSRSPVRRRSHDRRRSPRRRYRSPPSAHYRSSSPQRSPVHSPLRRRSPVHSPLRRRSPGHSPLRRRSPVHSPLRRRLPVHSPLRRRSPGCRRTPTRYRSPSPLPWKSPDSPSHMSPGRSPQSPPTRRKLDPIVSPRHRNRNHSPLKRTRRSLSRDAYFNDSERNSKKSRDNYIYERSPASARRPSARQPISLRSPQLDRENEASCVESLENQMRKKSPIYTVEESISPEQGASHRNSRQKKQHSPLSSHSTGEEFNFDDTERRHQKDVKHSSGMKKNIKIIYNNKERSIDSDSGEDTMQRQKLECKDSKILGYQKQARDKDDSFDSKSDIKEAKRKRKEERRLHREERRRKREERHQRRKEEYHAAKKAKPIDSVEIPSDEEEIGNIADGSNVDIRITNDNREDAESQQKRLEIELREKALASLRAMKRL